MVPEAYMSRKLRRQRYIFAYEAFVSFKKLSNFRIRFLKANEKACVAFSKYNRKFSNKPIDSLDLWRTDMIDILIRL